MELLLTLGVPDITPYESMERPFGKAGEISQVKTAPPLLEKVMAVIAESLVKVTLLCEGVMLAVGSLMVILMDTESEPPELLAQTV